MFLIVGILILIGLGFNALGAFSLYRFPDVYTRLHGATKCTTFGTLFTMFAVVAYSLGKLLTTGEARFGVFIINATGAHAIARAAHRSGIFPALAVVDRLEEKEEAKGGTSR